jgi:NAD-dependent dihydropyrimidine dehydrogenase PreA subunit
MQLLFMLLHRFVHEPQVGLHSLCQSRFRVQFDESLCNGCGICVKRCHFFAIDIDKSLKPKERTAQVDYDKCYGCGLCTLKCPTQALTMIEVRPRESVRNT